MISLAILFLLVDHIEKLTDLPVLKWVPITALIIFILFAVIVFIDFMTLGSLKKNRVIAKLYFPVYRIFGFITLSFLYRPIVYNFLDQKYTRWVTVLILPFYLIGNIVVTGFKDVQSNYFVDNPVSTSFIMNNENYEDFLIDSDVMAQKVIIPSKIITQDYLEVFMPYSGIIEDVVFKKDSTLRPKEELRGPSFIFNNSKVKQKIDNVKLKKYIEAVNKSYIVNIDSTRYASDFIFGKNKFDTFGFIDIIDISTLSSGRHLLCITAPKITSKGTLSVSGKKLINKIDADFSKIDTLVTIPFWYYKK